VIVNHLHIPLQSGCSSTLDRMNRKYDTIEFKKRIDYIKERIEDVSITTDVIVGFPGESEEEFASTVDFINEIEFFEMHVFPYSVRSGTKAALMKDQINPQVKQERVKVLSKLSDTLSKKRIESHIGKEVEVLIERSKNGSSSGHTTNFMNITVNKQLNSNKIVTVLITDYTNGIINANIVNKYNDIH